LATLDSRTTWGSASRRPETDGLKPDTRVSPTSTFDVEDPLIDAPKWAAWKVTLAVVLFCGAFWVGVGYIAKRLLG
jgi:hypothetical protein